jgi:hypothetical protein
VPLAVSPFELFLRAHDPTFAEEAVATLEGRLRRSPAAFQDEDLALLVLMGPVSQADCYDDSIGSGGTIEGFLEVDTSRVRELAAAEQARRERWASPVTPLARILADRCQDITLRVWAAARLGATRDPRALPPLARTLRAGYHLGAAAAEALGELGLRATATWSSPRRGRWRASRGSDEEGGGACRETGDARRAGWRRKAACEETTGSMNLSFDGPPSAACVRRTLLVPSPATAERREAVRVGKVEGRGVSDSGGSSAPRSLARGHRWRPNLSLGKVGRRGISDP